MTGTSLAATGNTKNPLTGKTVVVTRTADQGAELSSMLTSRGATVVHAPMIDIVSPASWESCDAALSTLDSIDAIIFSSPNAVKSFVGRATERGIALGQVLTRVRVYAVGRKTADELLKAGISLTGVPDQANAGELAAMLAREPVSGKRFLLPRGNKGERFLSQWLADQGAIVSEIIVYENKPVEGADVGYLIERLAQRAIDVVTFFSPSSFLGFVAQIPGDLLLLTSTAAIGTTTARAMEDAGYPPTIVASDQSAQGMVDAIVDFFTQTQSDQE